MQNTYGDTRARALTHTHTHTLVGKVIVYTRQHNVAVYHNPSKSWFKLVALCTVYTSLVVRGKVTSTVSGKVTKHNEVCRHCARLSFLPVVECAHIPTGIYSMYVRTVCTFIHKSVS